MKGLGKTPPERGRQKKIPGTTEQRRKDESEGKVRGQKRSPGKPSEKVTGSKRGPYILRWGDRFISK